MRHYSRYPPCADIIPSSATPNFDPMASLSRLAGLGSGADQADRHLGPSGLRIDGVGVASCVAEPPGAAGDREDGVGSLGDSLEGELTARQHDADDAVEGAI